MTTTRGEGVFLAIVLLSTMGLVAQGLWLPHGKLLEPLADSWVSYSGDYSGKRYSALTQLDRSNVKSLALAWTARVSAGAGDGGRGRRRRDDRRRRRS